MSKNGNGNCLEWHNLPNGSGCSPCPAHISFITSFSLVYVLTSVRIKFKTHLHKNVVPSLIKLCTYLPWHLSQSSCLWDHLPIKSAGLSKAGATC